MTCQVQIYEFEWETTSEECKRVCARTFTMATYCLLELTPEYNPDSNHMTE